MAMHDSLVRRAARRVHCRCQEVLVIEMPGSSSRSLIIGALHRTTTRRR